MDAISSEVPQSILELDEIDRASRAEHARAEACIDLDDEADARTKQSLLQLATQAVRESIKFARRNEGLPLSFQIENHLERIRDLVGDKGYVTAIVMTHDRERFDAIQLVGAHKERRENGIASKYQCHPRWALMIQHVPYPSAIPRR
jgi:hypothetical protein